MCSIITQAACHPLISGPVYSCYSSPCRWSKRASPFHSRVCSWSVGWQSTWGGKPESIKPREPWGPQILSCAKEGTASCSQSYGRGYDYCRTSCSATGCRMPFLPGFRWFGFQASKSNTLFHNTPKVQFCFSGSQLPIMAQSQGHPHGARDWDCKGWPAATINSQAQELGRKVSF